LGELGKGGGREWGFPHNPDSPKRMLTETTKAKMSHRGTEVTEKKFLFSVLSVPL